MLSRWGGMSRLQKSVCVIAWGMYDIATFVSYKSEYVIPNERDQYNSTVGQEGANPASRIF